MRFDSTLRYQFGEPYPWEKLVKEFRQEAALLDQASFTTVWIAEHHFAWDGWIRAVTNPIMLGADLASHTAKLRVGQCGVILPDWHPLRVAEDIALLDQLTEGRVDFGIARGLNNRASIQFNAYADRQHQEQNYALFAEVLDIVVKAWTQEQFSYQGQFYTFPRPGWKEPSPLIWDPRFHAPDGELKAICVEPKPYQKPHPPIWQMTDTEKSHRFAGERHIGAICMWSSVGKMNKVWRTYREAAGMDSPSKNSPGEPLAVMKPAYVAPTFEEAVETVRWGAHRREEVTSSPQARKFMVTEEEFKEEDLLLDTLDFQLKHDLVLVGSPDSVAEQIERVSAGTGCQHFVLFHNFPGLSFDKVMGSIDLLSERVLPRFNHD